MSAEATLIAHCGAGYVGRQELPGLPTPPATLTHKPIPHAAVVSAVVECLGYRHITVVSDRYAVTADGARLFGVMEIDVEYAGVRLALGIRNSHDRSFALAFTAGYRVFVCDNLSFSGDFTPVTRKHTKALDAMDVIDGAISRIQRGFEPLQRRIDAFRLHNLPDLDAKHLIYRAFVEGELDAPRRLAPAVHASYFEPQHDDFRPRTLWSLENAFTEALKGLDPVPQLRATADLARFLTTVRA